MYRNILYISILTTALLTTGLALQAQEQSTDAVYTSQLREYTLNNDGSWDYHYSHKLRLLTHFAFHSLYGEDFIVYNPQFQKLKINRSVTTMADGTVVPGPQNAFNELLPSFAANAPAFNHLREMAVTHTGLECGSVIDFDYSIRSSRDYSPGMSGNEALWMNSPVEQSTFIIHVPKGATLNYKTYNLEQQPLITKEAGGTTYTWKLTNLPAATHEDFRAREQQNRPRIVFSTTSNFRKQLQGFLSQPAFTLTADPALAAYVSEITSGGDKSLALALRIQDRVANDFNYFPVPLATTGYRLRTVSEVFSSNGGNEPEKAILLATILKTAGIPAVPVAVMPARFYDSRSSNLLQAEKFLVKVSVDGADPVYLSPLANDQYDQRLTLSGKKIIILSPGKGIDMEEVAQEPNDGEITANLNLDEKMILDGKVSVALSGRLNPWLKLIQDSSYSNRLIPGLAEGAEIKSARIGRMDRNKITCEYTLNQPEKVKVVSQHYFLKIPAISTGIESWHCTELISERTEPLELPYPLNESYRFTITLPAGYELITAESRVNIHKPFGSITIEISQEGRTLLVNRSISIGRTWITPAEYAEFKDFINTWNNKKYRETVLRIGPK